jgi:hypothetical protein
MDGHCGRLAADFAADILPRRFAMHSGFASGGLEGLADALRAAFVDTDADFLGAATASLAQQGAGGAGAQVHGHAAAHGHGGHHSHAAHGAASATPSAREWRSGSTALAVALRGDDILIASLGDCRAVLAVPEAPCDADGEGGSASASASASGDFKPCSFSVAALSREHTPESERCRIEAAGGWVVLERELAVAKLRHIDLAHPFVRRRLERSGGAEKIMRWTSVSRLNGELGVSRAIGDSD